MDENLVNEKLERKNRANQLNNMQYSPLNNIFQNSYLAEILPLDDIKCMYPKGHSYF